MEQPLVKIRATDPDGTTANITELCKSIVWSGDWRSAARTLRFSPVVSGVEGFPLPRAPTELGGSVQFWQDETLLMDAFALERSRDSLGSTIDVTAYDRGLYLTRNSAYLRVDGQTAEEACASLCAQFGIPAGALARTGVPLSRNFLGVSLYKIIMTLYTLASDRTGREYRVRFRGKELEVVEAVRSEESVLLTPGVSLLSCVTRESAGAMTNSVAVYNEECQRLKVVQDDASVALYGLMQAAVKAGSCDDPEARARQLVAENGLKTTITLEALGDLRLVTGNTCVVEEPVTGTRGLFWILSDSHTWSRGLYRTKLTVSLESIMDRQEAGK